MAGTNGYREKPARSRRLRKTRHHSRSRPSKRSHIARGTDVRNQADPTTQLSLISRVLLYFGLGVMPLGSWKIVQADASNGTLGMVIILVAVLFLESGWGLRAIVGAMHEATRVKNRSNAQEERMMEILRPLVSAMFPKGV